MPDRPLVVRDLDVQFPVQTTSVRDSILSGEMIPGQPLPNDLARGKVEAGDVAEYAVSQVRTRMRAEAGR